MKIKLGNTLSEVVVTRIDGHYNVKMDKDTIDLETIQECRTHLMEMSVYTKMLVLVNMNLSDMMRVKTCLKFGTIKTLSIPNNETVIFTVKRNGWWARKYVDFVEVVDNGNETFSVSNNGETTHEVVDYDQIEKLVSNYKIVTMTFKNFPDQMELINNLIAGKDRERVLTWDKVLKTYGLKSEKVVTFVKDKILKK